MVSSSWLVAAAQLQLVGKIGLRCLLVCRALTVTLMGCGPKYVSLIFVCQMYVSKYT